jgi:hypothetical protein
MRQEVEQTLTQSLGLANQYLAGVQQGLEGLNGVLQSLGEKQVVVQQVKKKGWFSRGNN